MIPYIRSQDVDHLLDWNSVANALAAGHKLAKPQISDQFVQRGEDTLLSRAAWIDTFGVAVKSVTVLPQNPSKGLPSVHGAMVLFDDDTGIVEAVIDSGLVTKWKTAGDSVLGAKLLARENSENLLIVGTGTVALTLIEAYRAVFPNINTSIWGRSHERAQSIAKTHSIAAEDDLQRAVMSADIISCATMALQPILKGEWLREGQHVDLIGAFKSDMREADDTAMKCSKIFVDSRETTIKHIGELMIPIANGVISEQNIQGDLYDLVTGLEGRTSNQDITLFKNGGGAHLDLMTGREILRVWNASR